MTLPEPGDLNWGAPLNDAIEAALSDAADAKADASSARDTAIDARMTADAVRDFVVAPADEQVASLVADDDAEAAGAVDTRIDTKVDPIRDLSDETFTSNLSASTAEQIVAETPAVVEAVRAYHLDAFNSFFRGQTNTWVPGQATTATTLTAQATAGATTLSVTSGAGLINGAAIVTDAGTANQQVYVITSGGGTTTLTLDRPVVTTLANGATITPLWANATHPGNTGYTAFGYFAANARKADGSYIITGTAPKVALLGDSWFAAASFVSGFTAALQARIPGATVVAAGVGGNTSAQMIARFATDVPADCDYVLINEAPGVNDIDGQHLSHATIAAQLETLLKLIHGIGAVPIHTGMVPMVNEPEEAANAATLLSSLLTTQPTSLGYVPSVADRDVQYARTTSPTFKSASPSPLGTELVTDPTVATGAGWTLGTGWTVPGTGGAQHAAGNTATLTTPVTITLPLLGYQVAVTVSGRTAGTITVALGSASQAFISASTTLTLYPSGSGSQTLTVTPTTDFDGKVSVSVKRVTQSSKPAATFGVGAAEVRAPLTTSLGIGASVHRYLLASASSNTGVGMGAQAALTSGSGNTGLGAQAQQALTTGLNNVGLGSNAQNALTSGATNVGVGSSAQQGITNGISNTAIGHQSQYAPNNVTGNATTSGIGQTSVGFQSGQGSATQRNYILTLGFKATADGNGAVAIGTDSGGVGAAAVAANEIALGTANHTTRVRGKLRLDQDQTTVGAAGAASALPATPTKYLLIQDSTGTDYVVPAYAKA